MGFRQPWCNQPPSTCHPYAPESHAGFDRGDSAQSRQLRRSGPRAAPTALPPIDETRLPSVHRREPLPFDIDRASAAKTQPRRRHDELGAASRFPLAFEPSPCPLPSPAAVQARSTHAAVRQSGRLRDPIWRQNHADGPKRQLRLRFEAHRQGVWVVRRPSGQSWPGLTHAWCAFCADRPADLSRSPDAWLARTTKREARRLPGLSKVTRLLGRGYAWAA
jgi:hypothetical protein